MKTEFYLISLKKDTNFFDIYLTCKKLQETDNAYELTYLFSVDDNLERVKLKGEIEYEVDKHVFDALTEITNTNDAQPIEGKYRISNEDFVPIDYDDFVVETIQICEKIKDYGFYFTNNLEN